MSEDRRRVIGRLFVAGYLLSVLALGVGIGFQRWSVGILAVVGVFLLYLAVRRISERKREPEPEPAATSSI